MPLITCPSCSAQYEVPDELIGRKVKCRQCGFKFLTGAGADAGERTAELTAVPDSAVKPPADAGAVLMELPGDVGAAPAKPAAAAAAAAAAAKPAARQSGRSAPIAEDDDEFAAALAAALEGEDESAPGKAKKNAPVEAAADKGDTFSDMGYGGTMALDPSASDAVKKEAGAGAKKPAAAAAADVPAGSKDTFSEMGYGGTMALDPTAAAKVQQEAGAPAKKAADRPKQVVVPQEMRAQEPATRDAEPATQMLPAARRPMSAPPQPGYAAPTPILIIALLCLVVAIGLGTYALLYGPRTAGPGSGANGGSNDGKGKSNSVESDPIRATPDGPLVGLDQLIGVKQESPLDAIQRYEAYRAQRDALQAEFAARQEALVAAYLYRPNTNGNGSSGSSAANDEAWARYKASADGMMREFDRLRGQMATVVVQKVGEVRTEGNTASATVRVKRWSFVTELGKPQLISAEQQWRYSLKRAGESWEIVDRTPVE